MTKLLLLTLAATTLLLSTGCFFSKKGKTKESSAIAGEVEETFRRRWVDKRVQELAATGVPAETARAQAEAEFRDRYGFAQKPQK
jgi:hypothetical protein